MPGSKQKLPILDAFRFIAASLVVLVHYEIIFGEFLIYGAFATTAVSWFFVVSGFILSYTYPALESFADYKRFYLHRVIRIYPVYFLAVMVSAAFVIAGYNALGNDFFVQVRRPFELSYDLPPEMSERFFTGALLRHLTFTQSIGQVETLKLLFNGPLWSLVLEMYFYLLFPLLLLLLKPVRSAGQIAALLVLGVLLQLTLIQLYLPEAEQYNVMNLNVPVYTNPVIRVIEFIFGMLLYKAFVVNNWFVAPPKLNLVPVSISILLYIIVIVLSSLYTPYQYHAFFLSVPFVTYMIYRLLEMRWHPEDSHVKFCTLLGGLSYVLYCFHWPLMEMLQFTDLLPDLPTWLHVTLLMSLLLALSLLIYKWIESPVRRLLYRLLDGENRRL